MSDAVEKTAAGATRTLFGSLGFILLMVGVEGITGIAPLPLLWAIPLIAIGVFCVYAAVFWENAKRIFSVETREAIARFAESPATRFGMLALVLLTIIFSPFIEQHRWPFSYPVDKSVYAERDQLRNDLNTQKGATAREKELADKWRFSAALRDSGLNCRYLLEWTPKANAVAHFWRDLFTATGWPGESRPVPISQLDSKFLITIRSKDRPASTQCAEVIQQELGVLYSNPPSKIVPSQQTSFLNSCDRDACVEIEVDY